MQPDLTSPGDLRPALVLALARLLVFGAPVLAPGLAVWGLVALAGGPKPLAHLVAEAALLLLAALLPAAPAALAALAETLWPGRGRRRCDLLAAALCVPIGAAAAAAMTAQALNTAAVLGGQGALLGFGAALQEPWALGVAAEIGACYGLVLGAATFARRRGAELVDVAVTSGYVPAAALLALALALRSEPLLWGALVVPGPGCAVAALAWRADALAARLHGRRPV
ncbi:MAG: hypothetical protein M9894_16535 [Planctomycetes bacterium]|nr:hypothetical protein [Planctomycetota bacterium]